jgi:Cof subfamily protein (haloacid dehalogenase superfamily)
MNPPSPDHRSLPSESIALVALDLDGTLLRSDGSVGVRSAEAIAQAVDAGVRVVLATGRAPRGMKHVASGLGLTTLQISHNGALIYDPVGKTIVRHQPLSGQTAAQVVRVGRNIDPALPIAIEVVDRCYSDGAINPFHREPTLIGLPTPGAFDALLRDSVTKIMMVGPTHVLGGVQMALLDQMPGRVAFSCSHLQLLQVVHQDANKAAALEWVANHYGVARHRVMAIGDAPNDLPMLAWAGLGVATANAWEEVREAAHFTVGANDDDGVAEAIQKYVLHR